MTVLCMIFHLFKLHLNLFRKPSANSTPIVIDSFTINSPTDNKKKLIQLMQVIFLSLLSYCYWAETIYKLQLKQLVSGEKCEIIYKHT